MAVVGSYGAPTVGTAPSYRTSTGGVQYGTPPKYRTYKAPPSAGAAPPWVPPPIPEGFYNPVRDIELGEGKRSTGQAERGNSRQRTEAENEYATNLSLEGTQHTNLLKQLAESSARLGVRQGEAENTRLGAAGIGGGALLASAAVRSANEGRERQKENERDTNAVGRIAADFQRVAGAGGSLAEGLANARENEQGYEEGVGTLKRTEASNDGYDAPVAPAAPHPFTAHFVRGSVKRGGTVEKSGRKLRTIRTYA